MPNPIQLDPPKEDSPEPHEYVQYPYRYLISAIFILQSFTTGFLWTVVTPIALPIASAYHQSPTTVALLPSSFMILYFFINFPSNWLLDVKGIRHGLLVGIALSVLGAGLRVLVFISFSFLLLGQFVCAVGQPFLLNATSKVAARWFLPESRSVALAVFVSSNIIGNAVGAILPPIFVPSTNPSEIKNQFVVFLIFEFVLSIVPLVMTIFWFEESPPSPASPAESTEDHDCWEEIKTLFRDSHFLWLNLAFGCIYGVYCMYGSITDNILSFYGYSSTQVSYFVTGQYVLGILFATLIGFYVEKTLNYTLVFRGLALVAILNAIGVPLVLVTVGKSFPWMMFLFSTMGIVLIVIIPLSFGYSCDVFYPAGEAQIIGALQTVGNLAGILMVMAGESWFGLGNSTNSINQNKSAALSTTIFASAMIVVGMLLYASFNAELKRSKIEHSASISYHNAG